MTKSNLNHSSDTASTRTVMTDQRLDLAAIMRQIRLCRSTLGAILEELECVDGSPQTLDAIAECTMNVTSEIEGLWETTKQPH